MTKDDGKKADDDAKRKAAEDRRADEARQAARESSIKGKQQDMLQDKRRK